MVGVVVEAGMGPHRRTPKVAVEAQTHQQSKKFHP